MLFDMELICSFITFSSASFSKRIEMIPLFRAVISIFRRQYFAGGFWPEFRIVYPGFYLFAFHAIICRKHGIGWNLE